MQIQLTDAEVELLEEAARNPSRLKADSKGSDQAVIELLLAMQLIIRCDGLLEITILGQHILKLARDMSRGD